MKILKPLIILFCLLLVTNISRSQILISILLGKHLNSGAIEFGMTGGFNRTYMYQIKDAEGLNHFNLGFYFDLKLKKETNWFLYTGVLVKSEMGASNIEVYPTGDEDIDEAMTEGSINRVIRYFNVPITVKHRFKNNLFVLGGAQLGLRHKASDEFVNNINDNDLVYNFDSRDYYRRIDAGFTAGAGYKFRYGAMMNIGLRYYHGLVDVFKEGHGYASNSALYVFAEIPIGAKRNVRPPHEKKEKKKKDQ